MDAGLAWLKLNGGPGRGGEEDRESSEDLHVGYWYFGVDWWLAGHLGLSLCGRERALRALDPGGSPINGLLDLKESLHVIFQSFVDLNQNYGSVRNFQLSRKHEGMSPDTYTLLFASGLHHDRDLSSLVHGRLCTVVD